MNQILESQQTHDISPSRVSYRVSIVMILEKIGLVHIIVSATIGMAITYAILELG